MQYSVVNYKTVKENSDFRIDAEYYHPTCLDIHEKIKFKDGVLFFSKIKKFSSGKNLPQTENGKYKFIRTQNIRPILIDDSGMSRTDELKNLKPTKEGEMLFVRVGEGVGNNSIITKNYSGNAISDNVLRLEIKEINPFFCSVFFNSKIGQIYFKRVFKGTARSLISQENFKDIFIPLFSNNFQKSIQNLIEKSEEIIEVSKDIYSQAEELLLSELGLLDWKPKHTLSFVKNFSDTQEAERFDAEYFQPKYEEIIEAVKKYKGGFDVVSGQFKPNKKSFKKITGKEYKYIEIGCINTSDGSMEPMILQENELPANAKIKLKKDDVIVSKVRPYRGAIGIVNSDDYVGSGAFTVLQEKGVVNKETLLVFLRLKPILDFSLKFNTGTSYPTITDEDILNFPLPKIDSKTQKEIKEKITEMYETKKLSKSLLEIAKRGVEMAIEKDEQESGKWIENKLTELGIKI